MTATSALATQLSLRCEGCGAEIHVDPSHRTAKCPYCASPAVVEHPGQAVGPTPTFTVGFGVPETSALETARKWIKRPLFAPSAFRNAKAPDIRGMYVPAYLYTAELHAEYEAQIGENYTVTETYTTTDSNGRTVTRTRTKVKTEWRSLSGNYGAYVSDVVVTASRGIGNAELEAVEPFDLRELGRFSPKTISGWIAEDPSMPEPECMKLARSEAMEELGRRLGRHMPGDSHRSLTYRSRFVNEDLELVLLPVWVLAVRYDPKKPAVRLLINGQTGKLAGRAPRSWPKIGLTIGLFLLLLVTIFVLAEVM